LGKYRKDEDIEVCVLKLKSTFFSAYVTAVHRAEHLLAILTCFSIH